MGKDYYLSNKVKHIDLEIKDNGNYIETTLKLILLPL